MKTYQATAQDRQRDWYVVDAEGKTLGRLATQIADALRGKRKPTYTPHVDTGDFVIVVNAEKIAVTGNKLEEKRYWRHSGYPGGIRSRTLGELLEQRPEEVIRKAVKGMLPRNRLARQQLSKLKVYAGPEHPHQAQKPETAGDRDLMQDEEQQQPDEQPEGTPEEQQADEQQAPEEHRALGGRQPRARRGRPSSAARGGARRGRRGRGRHARRGAGRRRCRRRGALRARSSGRRRRRTSSPAPSSSRSRSSRSASSTPRSGPPRGRGGGARPPRGELIGDADEDAPVAAKPAKLEGDARYLATGKRKSSIARVTLLPGNGRIEVNKRTLEEFFPRAYLQTIAKQPLAQTGYEGNVDVRVRVHGGGISGQAGAVRHGIARALTEVDPELRGELKRRGFLTRDARVKERRKAGLKKARKRPQFSKR